jgi:hypothetical protein
MEGSSRDCSCDGEMEEKINFNAMSRREVKSGT